ncbi:transcriptional regulator, TetR family [Burkholderia sp. b14]|nr:TetR/AcrR family transcriptional regulator [Mycetohabitans sp. B7]SIT71043.1 transcriptional regulator, TetR family [Burkholderia sp. b14]
MREKRQILLDTAARLFAQYGFHAVGIDRIIAESGIPKMTMYQHFASKMSVGAGRAAHARGAASRVSGGVLVDKQRATRARQREPIVATVSRSGRAPGRASGHRPLQDQPTSGLSLR